MDTFTSRPVLSTSLVLISAALLLRPLLFLRAPQSSAKVMPSPRETLLPRLSPAEVALLPYPPDALPGGRDVPTPYGTVRVFEFGPRGGARVLLLAGISTPCVSLSALAEALAARGRRVLLFDYFGRGWSDAPDPYGVDHDDRLYVSQVLCVLASSEVSWLGDAGDAGDAGGGDGGGGGGGFHIIGYSFGGGLAVSFASCFGRAVRSLTLIAPGGLMRRGAGSWTTAALYSRGFFPEAVLQYFVRRRFEPPAATTAAATAAAAGTGPSQQAGGRAAGEKREALVEQVEMGDGEGQDVIPFDDAVVSSRRPGVTVASVMAWQLRHHQGFVPAMMSSFRYGPIHERHEEWAKVGAMLAERRKDARLPGLCGGRVFLVLGQSDPIVLVEQTAADVKEVLGEDAVKVLVLRGGHEVAITRGREIADAAAAFWEESRQARGD